MMNFDFFKKSYVFSNKISNESPLGAAILDKAKGETVTVAAPKGEVKYKIVKFR